MLSQSNQSYRLSSEELKKFHENGYIGPFTLYEPDEMKEIFKDLRLKLLNTKTAIYQDPQEKLAANRPGLLGYDRHFDIPVLAKHIVQKKITDRLSSIIGNDILCWRTEFFPKYPGDEGTDWHQANTFAGVDGDGKPQLEWPDNSDFGGSLTVWTAFTECNIDNGCMQIIPGTHTTMYYDENKKMTYNANSINKIQKGTIKRGFFGYDFRQLQKDPGWRPDESKAVSLILRPGQFFIFWSTLLHASHDHAGKTNDMRLGFSARYVPTCVKIYPYSKALNEFGGKASLENHGCVLVSGVDKYGHNKIK